MPNMGTKISQHNAKVIKGQSENPGCNCRKPLDCPLPGRCMTDNVVYRATVATNKGEEKYVGLTGQTFKIRHENHKQDLKNPEKKHSTTLSTHIWKLMTKKKPYSMKFDIVCRAPPFSPNYGGLQTLHSRKIRNSVPL